VAILHTPVVLNTLYEICQTNINVTAVREQLNVSISTHVRDETFHTVDCIATTTKFTQQREFTKKVTVKLTRLP